MQLYTKLFKALIAVITVFTVAQPVQAEEKNGADLQTSTNLVQQIQQELTDKNTSVTAELNDLKSNYEQLVSATNTNETNQKLIRLADTTQKILDEYNAGIALKANADENEYGFEQSENLQMFSSSNSHSVEIGTVLSYFNMMGYQLSAELLTHMRDNNTVDSLYSPYYGYFVRSSQTFLDISCGTSTSGTGVFENQGGTREKDLYYAIHDFYYTKISANDRTVRISDRYDFHSKPYTSIANVAMTSMYSAQLDGALTPFYTIINHN